MRRLDDRRLAEQRPQVRRAEGNEHRHHEHEDAEPDIVHPLPFEGVDRHAGDDELEEGGVDRAEQVHAEAAEAEALDRTDHEDAGGPQHNGNGSAAEGQFGHDARQAQLALPKAGQQRGAPQRKHHHQQVAVNGRDRGEQQRPGPDRCRPAQIEPDRGENGPVTGERHVDVEPHEESGLKDAEDGGDQRQRSAELQLMCDQRREQRLQHEAQQFPIAPILEPFGQPRGDQLEREGKERQRVRQADAVGQFKPVERRGAGRPTPRRHGEPPPAERVHGAVALIEP